MRGHGPQSRVKRRSNILGASGSGIHGLSVLTFIGGKFTAFAQVTCQYLACAMDREQTYITLTVVLRVCKNPSNSVQHAPDLASKTPADIGLKRPMDSKPSIRRQECGSTLCQSTGEILI